MRLNLPSLKLCFWVAHGVVDEASSSSSSSPMRAVVPTGSSDHSMPVVVRFSPTLPGSTGWPSACSRSMASIAEQAHGAVRPAVDGVLAVLVALEAELADPRPFDRQLGHAAGRHVDLHHAAVRRALLDAAHGADAKRVRRDP